MLITLTRGNESVSIEANDDAIYRDLAYSNMFERQVKLLAEKFYGESSEPK